MKDKNSQNKSASVQILGTTKALTSEAADENLFEFIKKEIPDIQSNSLYEFNFYIYTDSEDKVMKCAEFINQGIASTTKYAARLIVSEYESSDEFGIAITFMGFPFNLDEIKKVSKFLEEAANKTECQYDSWEIGFPGSKKDKNSKV